MSTTLTAMLAWYSRWCHVTNPWNAFSTTIGSTHRMYWGSPRPNIQLDQIFEYGAVTSSWIGQNSTCMGWSRKEFRRFITTWIFTNHHHVPPQSCRRSMTNNEVPPFAVLQFNYNGIKDKIHKIKNYMEQNNINVVAIQESKLSLRLLIQRP